MVVTMHAALSDESSPAMKYNWEFLEKEWRSIELLCRRGWEQSTREVGFEGSVT